MSNQSYPHTGNHIQPSCWTLKTDFRMSALHKTALVIIAKQKESDLMPVLFRDQILSKSQQSLLSSKLLHHQNRVLYLAFSSFLTAFLCSWPYVAFTDHLFSIRVDSHCFGRYWYLMVHREENMIKCHRGLLRAEPPLSTPYTAASPSRPALSRA